MQKSKVYFTDMRADWELNIPDKLERLMKAAGFEQLPFKNHFAALKLHFGERGNLAYIRPNYAKVVIDYIKSMGGKPYLTDCNTLYVGGRKNALDHLDTAYLNGYSPLTTGCHIIIGDGLKGDDEISVEVPNGKHIKNAKIGRAIMDADIIITLNHFKGHEAVGYGGALKNIGMGCGSRAGKMEMHNAGKPIVNTNCISCGKCLKICAHSAINISEKANIDHSLCVGCGRCLSVCPVDAVETHWDESVQILCEKIAEYSAAVLLGRPNFHISLVMDVTPNCDCHSENDSPIVPNVGMFASFDPVALDVACADAVNAQTPLANSMLSEDANGDYAMALFPESNWRWLTSHAASLGLGSEDYQLINI